MPTKSWPNETAAPWELCHYPPPTWVGGAQESQAVFNVAVKAFKVVVYILTFVVVLVCGVLSQGTALLMTSQLRDDRSVPFCNSSLDDNNSLGRPRNSETTTQPEDRSVWTWCLLVAFTLQEVAVLLRSLWQCYASRSWRRPSRWDFVCVTLVETVHTAGLAVLFSAVLPDLDVVEGVMITSCLCVVPSVLSLIPSSEVGDASGFLDKLFDASAMVVQTLVPLAWFFLRPEAHKGMWLVPITLVCISCVWWENFTPKNSALGVTKSLWRLKTRLDRSRSFVYVFVSIWKILVFFILILATVHFRQGSVTTLFAHSFFGLSSYPTILTEASRSYPAFDINRHLGSAFLESENSAALIVLLVHMVSSFLCHIFANFACKLQMRRFSFALSAYLTGPVTLAVMASLSILREEDPCYFRSFTPDYLFFSPSGHYSHWFNGHKVWVLVVLVLSQIWITRHIWTAKNECVYSMDKLFVLPMYSSLLFNQSQGLNHRKHISQDHQTEKADEGHTKNSSHCGGWAACTPQVYACATLWHETYEEMLEVLQSVLRMDMDRCARGVLQEHLSVTDPNLYDLETHVFFDDAFEPCEEGRDSHEVNGYVRLMVVAVEDAVREVHGGAVSLEVPVKYLTPYGGRLVWTLPGATRLVVHLKGKDKIRLKKRWSQVMYMYYLLGHRLMEQPLSMEQKEERAMNTFLLSMDGDMAFQPAAVHALVTEMRKDRNLAVTCGRIHPFGSGPMVWFQKFEYGMGQWLHKATENLIGCVLCCPGAFSLFRGKVLMDDHIMAKYTAQSTLARHHVQQDQGEDRWLCSLLLQKGYRTRYVGNSKAYTHCPEDFNDFFIQRRRWVTSTISNLLELLKNYKTAVRINDNISMFYILYEIVIMNVMILGPGSIFLMFVGVIEAALHIDYWTSFYLNLTLMLIFVIVCFICKSEHQKLVEFPRVYKGPRNTRFISRMNRARVNMDSMLQLRTAQILSLTYTMVMVCVHLSTSLPWREGSTLISSFCFFFCITSFLLAAVFLPHHLKRVMPAVVYFFYSPALYLILIPYSIINLNVVSWGTRETKDEDSSSGSRQDFENKEFRKRSNYTRAVSCLVSCFRINLRRSVRRKINLIFSLADKLKQLFKFQSNIYDVEQPKPKTNKNGNGNRSQDSPSYAYVQARNFTQLKPTRDDGHSLGEGSAVNERGEMKSCWITDQRINGSIKELSPEEIQFWKDLLQKYLFPVHVNKERKDEVAADLVILRNSSVFVIFLMNGLFVLIMILVQIKDRLSNSQEDDPQEDTSNTSLISQVYSQLVSFVLMYFFATLFVIQMTSLIIDQFGTVLNLLATTDLTTWFKAKATNRNRQLLKNDKAVDIEYWIQKIKDGNIDSSEKHRGGNKGINHNNDEEQEQVKRTKVSLTEIFRGRFLDILKKQEDKLTGLLSKDLKAVNEGYVRREAAEDLKEHTS